MTNAITTKPKPIRAVFKKQVKDTFRNTGILLQFIIFPLIAFILTETIAKNNSGIPATYFSTLFATMYVGFVPITIMSSIISEEKEQSTLKALVMANVKPWQYLLGVGGYSLILCLLGSVTFGLISQYTGVQFVRFMLVMFFAILSSLLLGSAIALLTKNQMAATAISMPISMIVAFIPMIAIFNRGFEKIARFLYTQQINYLVNDLSTSNFTAECFVIIGSNILIFLLVFVIAYKKGNLTDE